MFKLVQDINFHAPVMRTLLNVEGISFLSFDRCIHQGLSGTHENGIELAAKLLNERGSLNWHEFYGGDAEGVLYVGTVTEDERTVGDHAAGRQSDCGCSGTRECEQCATGY